MDLFPPISSSAFDLERRRLESTIDQDLSTISLSSLDSALSQQHPSGGFVDGMLDPIQEGDETFSSGMGSQLDLTLEYPRGFGESIRQDRDGGRDRHDDYFPHAQGQGPTGTPRASAYNKAQTQAQAQAQAQTRRNISGGMSGTSLGGSPVSTTAHHVSAVSLADRVFRSKKGRGDWSDDDDGDASEFDPERSLGRLVGELGRVMGKGTKLSPRPSSPFSPPRSPSPLPSLNNNNINLSYTLSRAHPLPSPPYSGGSASGSGGEKENDTTMTNPHAHVQVQHRQSFRSAFTQPAKQPQEDVIPPDNLPRPIQPRRALSDSTAHNIQHSDNPATPAIGKNGKSRRVSALQQHGQQDLSRRKVHSAPAGRGRDLSADVTGMTGLMATPARGGEFESIDKNGDVGGDGAASIPQTLATLHARLRGLETENSLARRRVRELEGELERAKGEVEEARREGGDRLKEAIGQRSALEDLVKSLRSHLSRLTSDLEESKSLVAQLKSSQPPLTHPPSPPRPGTANELAALRREIERLSGEVGRLTGVVERGLETRRIARGEDKGVTVESETDDDALPSRHTEAVRPDPRPVKVTIRKETYEPRLPSKLRQGLHVSASSNPTLMPPSTGPPSRVSPPLFPRVPPTPPPENGELAATISRHSTPSSSASTRKSRKQRQVGPDSPFPSIRAEDEAEFFKIMESHAISEQPHRPTTKSRSIQSGLPELPEEVLKLSKGEIPPQTVLSRVIRELEDDFSHYKAIYCELADQYKLLDAASAAAKRHVLAEHLKEVIDTLEQKADQISSLYDLLSFRDRPDSSTGREGHSQRKVSKSVGDVMRMVRETLGEEGLERLRKEGVQMGKKRHVVL